ncbi:hypothetical protein [Enterococcus thailandicus]|uniref:hypothetical protein n=1 Tax=Enterococcus thailandicus TaxID=417368 RepID=UPI002891CEC6|nr:hypothetical protein [Enterococcus thailandicus]MDT2751940.1 hypothetical protein [Enterococcus thailandicus]MDT2776081.1 hypothetical protein [Enterococcus thailandicus]
MSELKEKIAEAIGNHISISDTYTYELTRVKTAFEAGTISLEDFEEWSDENVNNLAESIVDVLQPQLNDNQQIVLAWLKANVLQGGESAMSSIFELGALWELRRFNDNDAIRVDDAYCELSNAQEFEVLAAFAEWGLEQEEKHD